MRVPVAEAAKPRHIAIQSGIDTIEAEVRSASESAGVLFQF